MSHAFVRGTFSSAGFSPGGRVRKTAGDDPDDQWENDVLDSHMSIGDTMALLQYDGGIRKAASGDFAALFGAYERPEPSFNGCFRPMGRSMPETNSMTRCVPVVGQEQILPQTARSKADMIAEKHRQHRESLFRKG